MRVAKILVDEIEPLIERGRDKERHKMQQAHIQGYGQIQPIKVTLNKNKTGKKYVLVYGQGRLESIKTLGHKEIDAIIDDKMTEVEHIEQWFTENNSRRDLTPYDIARILHEEKEAGASLQVLSDRFRLSPGYISGIIKVIKKGSLKLKGKISKTTKYKRKTNPKEIRMNQAVEIASAFDEHSKQDAIVDALEEMGITTTTGVRVAINKAKELEKSSGVTTDNLIKSLTNIEDDLKNRTEEYYKLFTQKEELRKAYEALTNDQFFLTLAKENKFPISI